MFKTIGAVLMSLSLLVFLSGCGQSEQPAKPQPPAKTEQPKMEPAKPAPPVAEPAKPEHPKADPTKPEHPKTEHPK
ncbi:MAG: hypothetical protein ACYDIC_11835 [Desulfobaccales bacterium]